MKTNKISEFGAINADGKLLLPMDRINAYLKDNKGKRLIVKFEAAEQGSSALQQAYYYNYILPTIAAALYEQGTRMSESQVDGWLLDLYPGCKSESELGTGEDVQKARNLTRWQMSDFLDWIKQFAAENLYVYIEDSRTL